MLTFFALFMAQYIFVFLKAFQQRSVAFDHYRWVVPTSMLMASAEVFLIAQIAHLGLSPQTVLAVFAVGLGGGLGAISAMRVHGAMLGGHKD